jgi:hypothetical protein
LFFTIVYLSIMTPLKKQILTAEAAELAEASLAFLCVLGVLRGKKRLFQESRGC